MSDFGHSRVIQVCVCVCVCVCVSVCVWVWCVCVKPCHQGLESAEKKQGGQASSCEPGPTKLSNWRGSLERRLEVYLQWKWQPGQAKNLAGRMKSAVAFSIVSCVITQIDRKVEAGN